MDANTKNTWNNWRATASLRSMATYGRHTTRRLLISTLQACWSVLVFAALAVLLLPDFLPRRNRQSMTQPSPRKLPIPTRDGSEIFAIMPDGERVKVDPLAAKTHAMAWVDVVTGLAVWEQTRVPNYILDVLGPIWHYQRQGDGSMFDITNEIYTNAEKAREHLEAIHWPHGPICPHCGNVNPDRITKMAGKSTRPGVYKCNECRQPFSVTVGTIFERSHIPLNKWVLASHLMAASKKGMSAHQLHRMLGVTYKTAWFMAHRIREAMKEDVKSSGPLGGEGKTVEADETYYGLSADW